MSEAQVERMVAHQTGALMGQAALAGVAVTYVKPHGALNNLASREAGVARAVARAVKAVGGLAMLAPALSELHRAAEAAGLRAVAEAFADPQLRARRHADAALAGGAPCCAIRPRRPPTRSPWSRRGR